MRPKIEMSDDKVVLLFRSALLEDATTVNERLAAISADISIDDDVIWVMLKDDLWPDGKQTKQADAVAKMLWMEIEWSASSGDFPFAWPSFGEVTNSTPEYFSMVLDAHAGREIRKE